MARVSYVSTADAAPEQRSVLDLARGRYGRVANFFRALAQVPSVARWVVALGSVLQQGIGSPIEPRLRALVQVRVSHLNSCRYCVTHNSVRGRQQGCTDEELESLQQDERPLQKFGLFSERELAALAWAEAVARNEARRATAEHAALIDHFGEDGIVALTVLAAYRSMINRIQEALWIDLEDGDDDAEEDASPRSRDLSEDDLVTALATSLQQPGRTTGQKGPGA